MCGCSPAVIPGGGMASVTHEDGWASLDMNRQHLNKATAKASTLPLLRISGRTLRSGCRTRRDVVLPSNCHSCDSFYPAY